VKALVYTRPGELELQDRPIPGMEAGDVLVRVRATGVCGSDLDGFLGRSKARVPPLVLGHEFSGIVEKAHNGSKLSAGQRVAVYPLIVCARCRYCLAGRHQICPNRKVYGLDLDGALAEYVSAPEQCLFALPAQMTYVEGSLVEPLANALHVLRRCPPLDGQTGVVYGAGPIGIFVLWAAKQHGAARVAAVDVNSRRLAKAAELGADLVLNAAEQDAPCALLRWTSDLGTDFAIDAVGSSECRMNSVRSLAPGGTAVWIGLSGGMSEIDGTAVVRREVEIRGSYAYTFQDFGDALSLLADKRFPVGKVVSKSSLADGQSVFEDLASGNTGLVKVVFEI
jgi:threonine dehydrogenase-like Zn-dependent dehydrogenase